MDILKNQKIIWGGVAMLSTLALTYYLLKKNGDSSKQKISEQEIQDQIISKQLKVQIEEIYRNSIQKLASLDIQQRKQRKQKLKDSYSQSSVDDYVELVISQLTQRSKKQNQINEEKGNALKKLNLSQSQRQSFQKWVSNLDISTLIKNKRINETKDYLLLKIEQVKTYAPKFLETFKTKLSSKVNLKYTAQIFNAYISDKMEDNFSSEDQFYFQIALQTYKAELFKEFRQWKNQLSRIYGQIAQIQNA